MGKETVIGIPLWSDDATDIAVLGLWFSVDKITAAYWPRVVDFKDIRESFLFKVRILIRTQTSLPFIRQLVYAIMSKREKRIN